MHITQVVWLVILVLCVVVEASTAALVSIWFCAGALAAFLVSLAAPGALALQVVVFIAVSILALFALRPYARRRVEAKRVATNADASIGKVGQVVAEVQPGRFGRVRLEGLVWTARADEVLPVGQWVRVEAIEGVKLVVVPVSGPSAGA